MSRARWFLASLVPVVCAVMPLAGVLQLVARGSAPVDGEQPDGAVSADGGGGALEDVTAANDASTPSDSGSDAAASSAAQIAAATMTAESNAIASQSAPFYWSSATRTRCSRRARWAPRRRPPRP